MAERWELRARKLETRRARMPKHGQALAIVYANAVRKRAAATAERQTAPDRRGANPPSLVPRAA